MYFSAFTTTILLPSLWSLWTQTAAQGKPGIPSKPVYRCCRYPGWPTTVLNFEYPDQNPVYQTYHGLTWKGWTGYQTYPGYAEGWAPIPSNYTTLISRSGPNSLGLVMAPGSFAFEDVHSLWFRYYETGETGSSPTTIRFLGFYKGKIAGQVSVITEVNNPVDWKHVCFNWTQFKDDGQVVPPPPVDLLVIHLPDCSKRGCKEKVFEIDDVWVRPQGLKSAA